MSLLESINSPADLKRLPRAKLPELAAEIRQLILKVVSQTGGHLAPSLGAVDLAIAIHYVFDVPRDRLIWDVGHQAYAHKILTGRRDAFKTLRQHGGLSGFTRRSESPFDAFTTGHSSTSISAAYGMATLVLANHGTGARYVGHVEDVFVSRDFRRQGIGESLMRALIAEAKRRDVISLWLTSNPRRIPAHRLYEKLGFARLAKPDEDRDHATNLYMLSLRPI